MIFLPLKKICDNPKFLRLNKIKLWTKFSSKLGCRLRLQLHLIYIYLLLNVNFDKSIIGYK